MTTHAPDCSIHDKNAEPAGIYDCGALDKEVIADLLEALKLTRMSRGWQYMSPETREIIDAALYKAEGK